MNTTTLYEIPQWMAAQHDPQTLATPAQTVEHQLDVLLKLPHPPLSVLSTVTGGRGVSTINVDDHKQ